MHLLHRGEGKGINAFFDSAGDWAAMARRVSGNFTSVKVVIEMLNAFNAVSEAVAA